MRRHRWGRYADIYHTLIFLPDNSIISYLYLHSDLSLTRSDCESPETHRMSREEGEILLDALTIQRGVVKERREDGMLIKEFLFFLSFPMNPLTGSVSPRRIHGNAHYPSLIHSCPAL